MKVSTEAAREIAADARKIIYPEGRVRQLAADLVRERERIAELEAQLSGELKHRIQARTSKPEWQSFLTLKYGEARTILVLLQDGQISVCKACEALAELAHGVSPRIPEPQGEPLSDDVVPSKRIAELEAQLAEARRDGERLDYMVESTNTGNDLIALWLLEDALDLLDPEDVYSDAALRHAVRQMIDKHMMRSELGAAIAAAAAEGEKK